MWKFGEVETALSSMHFRATEFRSPFRNRLRHLQRVGIPLDRRVGKGKQVDFSLDEVFQITLSLELTTFGFEPSSLVPFFRAFWNPERPSGPDRSANGEEKGLAYRMAETIDDEALSWDLENPMYISICPVWNSLEGSDRIHTRVFGYRAGRQQDSDFIEYIVKAERSVAIINISLLVARICSALHLSRDDRRELYPWAMREARPAR